MSDKLRRFESRVKASHAPVTTLQDDDFAALFDRNLENLYLRTHTPGYALERISPESVKTAARAITRLAIQVNGRAIELAGNRDVNQWREILRNLRPFTGDDVARLAHQAPGDLCAWLREILLVVADGAPEETLSLVDEIAGRLGRRVSMPEEATATDVDSAFSEIALRAGETLSESVLARSPAGPGGSAYTLEEIRRLRQKAHETAAAAQEAEMALRRAEMQFSTGDANSRVSRGRAEEDR